MSIPDQIAIRICIPETTISGCWVTEFGLLILGSGGMRESAVVPGFIFPISDCQTPEHRVVGPRPATAREIKDHVPPCLSDLPRGHRNIDSST